MNLYRRNSESGTRTFTCPVVMLIDDSEIDNFINQKMIEGCKFAEKIHIYTHSKNALEFFKNIESFGETKVKMLPQIIFLDINMPIMNGFQFLEGFHKLSECFTELKNIKVVMLTSSINPHDVEKASEDACIIKFINKPLSQEVLANLSSEYLELTHK